MRYVSEDEAYKMFDDYLDECFEPVVLVTIQYPMSKVLEDTDPIHYYLLYKEWCDSEGITNFEDEADETEEAE